MVQTWNDIIQTLQDPAARHAALVHMPIALSLLGVLLCLLSAVAAGRNAAFRWIAFGAYVLLAGAAWFAADAGEDAHDQMGVYPAVVYELVEEHEERAEWISRIAAGLAILLAIGVIRKPAVRHGSAWLAVAGSLGLAGWTGYTAHLGGKLVYRHGVGTAGAEGAGGGAAASDEDVKDDPRLAFFREQALPILEQNCMRCHNPARAKRSGGLDQTTMAGLLKGGMDGPALVPGQPAESLMIKAVRHQIEDLEMPPKGGPLPEEKIVVLEKWIRDGAVWDPDVRVSPPAPPADDEADGGEDPDD